MHAVTFSMVELSAGLREVSTGWIATELRLGQNTTDYRGHNTVDFYTSSYSNSQFVLYQR